MPHQAVKAVIGLALGMFVAGSAHAFPLVSPISLGGFFSRDDEVRAFEFTIATDSLVTIETVSYGGGDLVGFGFADPGGGFDPIISLFDSAGLFLDEDDDDDDGLGSTNADVVTGEAFDAFLQPVLAAGTYTLVITQFDNFFLGVVGDHISAGFEFVGDPFFTSIFGCGAGQFCDVSAPSDSRVNRFSFNLSAVSVPEPTALALLGFGLLGVGMAYRRRQQG
jgi:hypothetical protein